MFSLETMEHITCSMTETLHLHQTTTASLDTGQSALHRTSAHHHHHPPEGEGSPDVPQLGCEELGAAVLRLLASDALTDIFC